MTTPSILTAFNDHFMEFVEDIHSVFPEDEDILIAKNSIIAIRKANPKLLVRIWNVYVVGKYSSVIQDGDIGFFINKDYSEDLTYMPSADKIVEAIDRLRTPIKNMNAANQAKSMKYIQNLTKLSAIYEAQNPNHL